MRPLRSILFLFFYSSALYGQDYFKSSFFGTQILKNEQGKLAYATNTFGKEIKHEKLITPFKFDWAEPFNDNGLAKVEINKKYGIIDTLGTVVVPINTDYIFHETNGYYIAKSNTKFGAFDKKGNLNIPYEYDYLSSFDEFGFAMAVLNGKWGVVNNKNVIILPFKYELIGTLKKGYFRAFLQGWNFFDNLGNQILNNEFTFIEDVRGTYIAATLKDGLTTVIVNKQGNKIIEETFQGVNFHPTKDIAIVKVGQDAYRLYDLAQKKYFNQDEYLEAYFEGADKLKLIGYDANGNEESFFADLSGKRLHQQKFDFISKRKNGGYAVGIGDKSGILDDNFKTVIPIIYGNNDAYSFQDLTIECDRIYAYKENEGWGMLDSKGTIVLPFEYVNAENPKFTAFKASNYGNAVKNTKTGKVGYLDKMGKWLIAPGVYDAFGNNQVVYNLNQYLIVIKAGKKGIYDLTSKKEIIAPRFEEIDPFFKYALQTKEREKQGILMLETLTYFTPSDFEYINYFEKNNQLLIKKGGKLGVNSLNGTTIIEAQFDEIIYNDYEKCYSVYKNKKAGFIDENGKTIIPLIYDRLDCPPPKPFDYMTLTIPTFSFNASFVRFNNKSLVIDKSGKIIASEDNFKLTNLNLDCFPMLQKIRFGKSYGIHAFYSNKEGKEIYEVLINGNSYDNFGGDINNISLTKTLYFDFYNGLIAARKNGKFGYLDLNGNEVIPFNFDRASNFNNGLATVKINGQYFKINEKGEFLKHVDGELLSLKRFDKNK